MYPANSLVVHETNTSIDIEVIRTVFVIFFNKRYFKHLKHKQKHLK